MGVPSPWEANQLAINKHGQGVELATTRNIQLAFRAGLELGTSELQVQRSDLSATLPLYPSFDIFPGTDCLCQFILYRFAPYD